MPKVINNGTKLTALTGYNNAPRGQKNKIIGYCKINRSSFFRWKKRMDEDNFVWNQRKTKYTPEIKAAIRDYVIKRVDISHISLIKYIKRKYKINIGKTRMYEILKEMKLTKKKIKKMSTSKNKRLLKKQIREFKKKIKGIQFRKIICVDEVSYDTHLSPTNGWSEKGKKIEKLYNTQRKRYTEVCSISHKKILHTYTIQGSANAEKFLSFIKGLILKIRKGSEKYLLLDNARIHHNALIIEEIQAANERGYNIKLIFLPPYSPKFNPIERVFSKVKNEVRKQNNTKECSLLRNIKKCEDKVSEENLFAFYKRSLRTEVNEDKFA